MLISLVIIAIIVVVVITIVVIIVTIRIAIIVVVIEILTRDVGALNMLVIEVFHEFVVINIVGSFSGIGEVDFPLLRHGLNEIVAAFDTSKSGTVVVVGSIG